MCVCVCAGMDITVKHMYVCLCVTISEGVCVLVCRRRKSYIWEMLLWAACVLAV